MTRSGVYQIVREAFEQGNRPDRIMRAVAILTLLVAIVLGYVAPPGTHDEAPTHDPAPEQQQRPEPPPNIRPV